MRCPFFAMFAAVILACPLAKTFADDAPARDVKPRKERLLEIPVESRIEVHSSTHEGIHQSSKSRSMINGVTTVEVREGRDITRIVEDPDEGITVETSKTYDSSNMQEIRESHPNVYSYLEKAPQGMGPTKFRVTIEIAELRQAASADELKKKHPKAFELYQQHMKEDDGLRFTTPRIAPPRLPALPKGIEIRPR